MVLWCRHCGALIGVRPPLEDWTVDRNCLCAHCVESQPVIAKKMERAVEREQCASTFDGPIFVKGVVASAR
jgi:hypothetical protein